MRRFARLTATYICAASVSFLSPAQGQTGPSIPSPVRIAQSAESTPIADKWAVVVGISKFANPRLNLHYTAKDAQDFYNYLIHDAGFAPDHVVLLQDEQATRENILAAVGGKWLPHNALPNDLVVIMLSTHGSTPEQAIEGVNYIVVHDTDVDNIYGTGIAMQDIMRMIKGKVHSERVVMLVDACHSGTIDPQAKQLFRTEGTLDPNTILQGCGQIAICSSTPGEVSWESGRYPNSVFIHQLIAGLKSKGPNTSIDDAYAYLKSNVMQEIIQDRAQTQTPQMKSKWQGAPLVLGARPAEPHRAVAWIPSITAGPTAGVAPAQQTVAALPPPTAAAVAPQTVPVRMGYFNLAWIKAKYQAFADVEAKRLQLETTLRGEVDAGNKELADAQAAHKSKEEIDQMARALQSRVNARHKEFTDQVAALQNPYLKIAETAANVARSRNVQITLAGDSVYVGGDQLVTNGSDLTNDICSALGIPLAMPGAQVQQPVEFPARIGYFNLTKVKAAVPESALAESFRVQAENDLRRQVIQGNQALTDAQKQGKSKAQVAAMAKDLQARINAEQQRLITEAQSRITTANQALVAVVKRVADAQGITLVIAGEGTYSGGDLIVKSGVELTNQILSSAAQR